MQYVLSSSKQVCLEHVLLAALRRTQQSDLRGTEGPSAYYLLVVAVAVVVVLTTTTTTTTTTTLTVSTSVSLKGLSLSILLTGYCLVRVLLTTDY